MRLIASVRHFIAICWLCGLTRKNQNVSHVRLWMLLINFSLCINSCFQCCSNNFTFGSLPGEKFANRLDKCRLLLINSIRLFVAALLLDVALSTFINWESHLENKISLCDSYILGKLAPFPSFESCHDRKLVNLSSAFSNSSLASTDFSIIDAKISHKGMANDILWHRVSNC